MIRIAVFASGTGSNYEQIMLYLKDNPEIKVEVALVVSDKLDAGVLDKAASWQTPVYITKVKDHPTKKHYEEAILHQLHNHNIEYLVLAGYMRLIGATILMAYPGKIINIHPSLLPAFPGIDAVGQALAARVNETGVTIHFVDEGMDTGPIIVQETVPVSPIDTHESLSTKIHTLEHKLFPRIVCAVATQEVVLDNSEVIWQAKQ